jgi:plasmid stabilization system protein ParE
MTVRYERHALSQIAEIINVLSAENPTVAAMFARRIEALASLLARHPMIGRRTDLADVRVAPTTPYPYLLFYRPAADGITVLRVRHMARNEDWHAGR